MDGKAKLTVDKVNLYFGFARREEVRHREVVGDIIDFLYISQPGMGRLYSVRVF